LIDGVRLLLALLWLLSSIAYLEYGLHHYWAPALALASSTITLGFLGVLVAARRLYFLAGEAPHAALLSALLAAVLYSTLGVRMEVSMLFTGILLIYGVGYPIFRGLDPDTVTAVFVSITASMSVILAYLVQSMLPPGFSVEAVVFGDPLLAGRADALLSALVMVLVALATLLTYREQVYVGFSREHAALTGMRLWVYDLVFFTMLGVGLSMLVKTVGFILEHVLILLPGAIASQAPDSRKALAYALTAAYASSSLGLWLGYIANVSPSGATGLLLFAVYAASLLYYRR